MIMGMEAINGFSPLLQQTTPQVKTQVAEQNQSQSEIANFEAAAPTMELKVEAADNSAGSNNNSQNGLLEKKQQERAEATEEQIQADNEKIKKAISDMAKSAKSNAEAVFGIHEKTNRVTIKMVDKDTKKVIKEFPPEETLDRIAKMWEVAGIMVDEKR